jgi:predicted flap endonuclease-1-like 5' DNA nuclease
VAASASTPKSQPGQKETPFESTTEPVQAFVPRVKAASGSVDDLKRIHGIGPFIERKLNEIGITTFRQIALFTSDDVARVGEAINFFPDRMVRDNWMDSARAIHKADYGEEPAED